MSRGIAIATLAAALLVLAVPDSAQACAMCMGKGGGTGKAFAIGSFFLSITPLAVIGTAVWYLRRRARALRAAELEPGSPVSSR